MKTDSEAWHLELNVKRLENNIQSVKNMVSTGAGPGRNRFGAILDGIEGKLLYLKQLIKRQKELMFQSYEESEKLLKSIRDKIESLEHETSCLRICLLKSGFHEKDLFEKVFNDIPYPLLILLADHTVIDCNRSCHEFFCIDEGKAKGKKCFELIGRGRPCRECAVKKSLESKKSESIAKYFPELDKHADCLVWPVMDDNGNVIMMIEHLREITG